MKSTRSGRPRGHEAPLRLQGPPGCGGPRERGRITSSEYEIALDAGAREHAGTDADGALVDHQVAHVQVVGSSSRGAGAHARERPGPLLARPGAVTAAPRRC